MYRKDREEVKITLERSVRPEALVRFAFKEDAMSDLSLKPSMQDKGAATWFYGREDEEHVLVAGLGEKEDFTLEILRQVAGNAGRAMKKEQIKTLSVDFNELQGVQAKEGTCHESD